MTSTLNLSLRQFRTLCILGSGLPAYHDTHTGQQSDQRRQSLCVLFRVGLVAEDPQTGMTSTYTLTPAGKQFYDAQAADFGALFRGEPAVASAAARGGDRHQPPPDAGVTNRTVSFQVWMEKVATGYPWGLVHAEFDHLRRAFNSGESVPAARRSMKQAAECAAVLARLPQSVKA